jgi:hypothetical protein
MAWLPPELALRWGPWEEPSAEEEARVVDHVVKAYEARLITRQTAVTKLSAVYGIENARRYARELEEERDEHGSLELAERTFGSVAKTATPKADAEGAHDDPAEMGDENEDDEKS